MNITRSTGTHRRLKPGVPLFFEISRVLVCFNHIASFTVDANHGMM
jgi:hypothetical protein